MKCGVQRESSKRLVIGGTVVCLRCRCHGVSAVGAVEFAMVVVIGGAMATADSTRTFSAHAAAIVQGGHNERQFYTPGVGPPTAIFLA